MSLTNKSTYVRNLWNWDFLSEVLPGKIAISDLDGFCEINGQFLYIEAKSPGKQVPQGQVIAFNHLIEAEHNQVLILWGDANDLMIPDPTAACVWPGATVPCTLTDVRTWVWAWARFAGHHKPTRRLAVKERPW